ncbi:PREDICTED: xanthine dehydrogenase/oxidase-like [Priapulus caudatus]|uniref:Xanthine dehydrogenase/oxidase-like n=1 Tax=Priapulus caudatus TaxID=37621 RepID=A0ABM1DXF0_PRICU|nr:PREDICTED: xanthine dehydrogenase/oxidase-like [Priapulus caudatus]
MILCYGGVAPSMVNAKNTSRSLIGRRWDEDMLSVACESLKQELVVTWVDNQVGALLEYKQRLITGLFFKFYMKIVDSNQPADDPIGELFAGLVTSTRAHARIVSVDPQTALATSGVVCYFDHHDIPGKKYFGPITEDEPIFAIDEVESHGHIIGCVVAKNRELARKAAASVVVQYEDLPAVLTIEVREATRT